MTATTEETKQTGPLTPRLTYTIAALMWLTYVLYAIQWKSGDFYIAGLGLGGSRTALLTNAITIAQVVGSLSAANILLKLGPRWAFAMSSFLIVLGFTLAFADVFPMVFAIRFMLGFGGSLTVVYMGSIVAKILQGNPLQVVNGLNSVAFNIGMAVALTFALPIRANAETAILSVAAMAAVVLVLWILVSGRTPKATGQAAIDEAHYTMRDGFKEPFNLIFALGYSGLLAYYVVSFTFMHPDNVKWVIYAGVVGALTGTVLASRTPDVRKPRVVVISAALQLAAAAAMVAGAQSDYVAVIGMILGFAIFFPMPFFVQLAFIRPGATPRRISVTMSIFWALSYGVSTIVVWIFGKIADLTGGLDAENIPVSVVPMIFIVIIEGSFLVGSIMLMRYFKKVWAFDGTASDNSIGAAQ